MNHGGTIPFFLAFEYFMICQFARPLDPCSPKKPPVSLAAAAVRWCKMYYIPRAEGYHV